MALTCTPSLHASLQRNQVLWNPLALDAFQNGDAVQYRLIQCFEWIEEQQQLTPLVFTPGQPIAAKYIFQISIDELRDFNEQFESPLDSAVTMNVKDILTNATYAYPEESDTNLTLHKAEKCVVDPFSKEPGTCLTCAKRVHAQAIIALKIIPFMVEEKKTETDDTKRYESITQLIYECIKQHPAYKGISRSPTPYTPSRGPTPSALSRSHSSRPSPGPSSRAHTPRPCSTSMKQPGQFLPIRPEEA